MSGGNSPNLQRLFGSLCLALVLLFLICAAPAFAAESGSGSEPLPSGIKPVVILSGSDYEMGYQYAQQAIAYYGPWFYQKTPGVYEPFSDAQIAALKAYQYYVMQYAPENIEYLKGEAAGATAAGVPMTYAEALARLTGTRAFPGTEPPESADDTLPPTGLCSVWAAWGRTTKDGSLIAGDSSDGSGAGFGLVEVVYPYEGNSYIWSDGGMNDKGVFCGLSDGEAVRDIDVQGSYEFGNVYMSAWPFRVSRKHALRFTSTAKDAMDFYASKQVHWGGDNQTFVDVTGDAYVLESSAAFQALRRPGDFGEGDFIHTRNTFLTDEGGPANLGDEPGQFYPHGGWAQDPKDGPVTEGDWQMASVRTNQTMFNMFNQYQGKVDLDFAKMLWRFAGKLPRDAWSLEEFRATKAAAWETPGNLENTSVSIYRPDNGDSGTAYVCTGQAGRVAAPYSPDEWGGFYNIGGTNTFYELTLAADPATAVAAAKQAALDYTHAAYQRFMWIDFGDVSHDELTQLFDLANTEYYDGVNWMSKARLAAGNDKMLCNGRALTAFAKAQAHAQQVYEALVRPPVTPSDLGLKKYKAISYGF